MSKHQKLEVFRDKVPWLDESMRIVGIQIEKTTNLNKQTRKAIDLKLIRITTSGEEKDVHDICEFRDGEIKFTIDEEQQGVGIGSPISVAERLCLSVMPRGFNATKMAAILSDPFWQYVINHFSAVYVMET